jgi:hypothetical protein
MCKNGLMKTLYQKYGKVFIVTHIILSIGFGGLFYYLVKRGFDIKPYLEKIGINEEKFKNAESASQALTAYAIYKVTMPLRLGFTAMVVPLIVKILKK